MNRFIAINPNRCIACGTCLAACSEGHRKAGLQETPRMALYQSREIVASVTCHHCEGAPCAKVCPVNAIRHDEDGCVRVSEQDCVGCKLCAVACPFGAIHMGGTGISGVAGISYATPTYPATINPILHWDIGVYSRAVKCDLCSYDPEGYPHCVRYCVTNALRLVDSSNERMSGVKEKREKAVEASLVMLEGYDALEEVDQ